MGQHERKKKPYVAPSFARLDAAAARTALETAAVPGARTLIEVVHCPKCGTLNRAPEFAPTTPKSQLTCRGCYAKPEVMQSDIFLKPVHYYWAVDCKRCSFVITLAEMPDRLEIERARATLRGFKALCPACKTELEYQPADVIVWSGPPPTPAFIAHPAFVKIRKA